MKGWVPHRFPLGTIVRRLRVNVMARKLGHNRPITLAMTCRTFGDILLAQAFRAECHRRGISVQQALRDLVANYFENKYK